MSTLLVLSDPHLVAGPDGADARARLDHALEALCARAGAADALVLCGDLADRGEPEVYAHVRRVAGAAAAQLGAQLVVLAGNHDDVGAVSAAFLDGGPVGRAVDVRGLRLVVADSVVAGADHGELTDEALAGLAATLAEPAPRGNVLLLHHPPVPSPSPVVRELMLRAPERLAGVLRGSDVRMVVCGHFHQALVGALAGVPVVVAPSLAPQLDPLGHTELLPGGDALRVDELGGELVATYLPLGRG